MRKLVKGNEAVVLGALAAGCDAYFGYPITPASEIAELTARYYLQLGKIFIQAECEVASISMLYGGASAGLRVMSSSSGPGVSLMQEGISYFSCAELPVVLVDVMRVGPGIGNIGPEQTDYFQVVKGGGHGSYRVIVLTPNSATETYLMTIRAFELADTYRMPVFLLTDATLGQMMEPLEIVPVETRPIPKEWKLDTTSQTNQNLLTTIYMDFDEMEAHLRRMESKFKKIEQEVAEAESYRTEDATIILTGYGIISRILHSVVDQLRDEGVRAGLIRPKTVWPFPTKAFRNIVDTLGKDVPFLAVELSAGQYVEDVRLAVPEARVEFYGRLGGNVPSSSEIIEKVRAIQNV